MITEDNATVNFDMGNINDAWEEVKPKFTVDDALADPRYLESYKTSMIQQLASQNAKLDRIASELGDENNGWVDVADIIAHGAQPPEPPDVMCFADDPHRGLLYAGRYNSIFGDGGQGKTLLTAAIQADYINRGQHVVHLEYDNNPPQQIVWRVIASGARPEQVAEFFHVRVSTTVIPKYDFKPSLVTLDSVNAAISAFDVDPNSSSRGVDMMIQRLIEPFTMRGATALALDHVGHSEQDRPSNNRRKIQAVQGIMLRVEREGPGRVGERWMSRLTVIKDNPGWCGVDVGAVLGYSVFDGRADDGTVQVSLWRSPLAELAQAAVAQMRTVADELLDVLRTADQRLSTTQVHNRVKEVYTESYPHQTAPTKRTMERHLNQLVGQGLVNFVRQGAGENAPKYWFAVTTDSTTDSTTACDISPTACDTSCDTP